MDMNAVWRPIARRMALGEWQALRLEQCHSVPPRADRLKRPGLYLHVPFCHKLCPFCPYHRIEFDSVLYARFAQAAMQEISLYADSCDCGEIVSLYVGGGTPTVDTGALCALLRHIQSCFAVSGSICVEVHPADATEQCFSRLADAGVTMISIGAQSLADPTLAALGRSHDARTAMEAIRCAVRADFATVNVDLMFALPGQTLEQWREQLRTVLGAGIGQLSAYPLFGFPYSEFGQALQLKRARRPDSRIVRQMLDIADEEALRCGLSRCAVWSWIRPQQLKFSSVSRHHYLGFGPSAASMTGSDFYVNTFDVGEYVACLPKQRPIALNMQMGRRREMAYWLYWRLYELHAEEAGFAELFGSDCSLSQVFGAALKPLELLGWMKRRSGGYDVTRSGAYWVHRLQNEYSLDYITKLWGRCRDTAWPEQVVL